jgi:hypothetical protein
MKVRARNYWHAMSFGPVPSSIRIVGGCAASWTITARTWRGVDPVTPQHRLPEAVGENLALNEAATHLTSPLGRVLDAGRHQLCRCRIRSRH